jgi:hypothetical protein
MAADDADAVRPRQKRAVTAERTRIGLQTSGGKQQDDTPLTQIATDRSYPPQLRGSRRAKKDQSRTETAQRVQEWIVRGDDAHVGTIQCCEESHRVGEARMIRDKKDWTAWRHAIEPGDLDGC